MVRAPKVTRATLKSVACSAMLLGASAAYADTLEGALVQAYQNNPALNSQRASVRATDEGVPQALSGYRPKLTLSGSIGQQYWDTTTKSATFGQTYTQLSGNLAPCTYGATVTQ